MPQPTQEDIVLVSNSSADSVDAVDVVDSGPCAVRSCGWPAAWILDGVRRCTADTAEALRLR